MFWSGRADLSKPAADQLASGDAENGFAGFFHGAVFCGFVVFACRHCRGGPVHLTYICVAVFCSVIWAEAWLAACSGCADRLSWCMACSAPGQPWLSPLQFLPVLAGAFYALSSIATKRLCADENPLALVAVYFAVLGAAGLIWAVLAPAFISGPVPPEAAFIVKGLVWADAFIWFWVGLMAVLTVLSIWMLAGPIRLLRQAMLWSMNTAI